MKDWKGYELLEREAGVLRSLRHDGIPAYLDRLSSGTGAQAKLVQEYVEGMNLQDKVASGWHGIEEEICTIAARLLEAVQYIHSLRPPIIHRDINPRNVIMRDDGAVFLVDVGDEPDRRGAVEVRILLDTNRYRDFCDGAPEAVERLQAAELVFMSFVTLTELRDGQTNGTWHCS